MAGKVAVVTGANSGIGAETALALARMGAHVVLACRNRQRAEDTARSIRADTADASVDVAEVDLADLASVRRCADGLLAPGTAIDIVVANAGGIWSPRRTTAQGFEMTFGVNHLAHMALIGWLLPRLRSGAPSRVVVVASVAHWGAFRGLDFNDLQAERRYRPFNVYARSKLANVLFTRELARRLAGTGVTANAVHPGPVRSGFGMDGDLAGLMGLGNRLIRPFEITPAAGAATSVHVAAAPELVDVSGGYFARSRPSRLAPWARSTDAARRLWDESLRLLDEAGFPVPELRALA